MPLCSTVCFYCLLSSLYTCPGRGSRACEGGGNLSSTHPFLSPFDDPLYSFCTAMFRQEVKDRREWDQNENWQKYTWFYHPIGSSRLQHMKVGWNDLNTRCRGELYQRGQVLSVRPRGITPKNPHSCSPLLVNHPATLSLKHRLSVSLSLPLPDNSQTGRTPPTWRKHIHMPPSKLWFPCRKSAICCHYQPVFTAPPSLLQFLYRNV